jgi:hypothetical protein
MLILQNTPVTPHTDICVLNRTSSYKRQLWPKVDLEHLNMYIFNLEKEAPQAASIHLKCLRGTC